jgi:pyruvate/2-oxoglutarate dehydrogenase complex dihydrolipoamide acyltransferase (E2) component
MLTEIRVSTIADAGPKLSIGRWFKSAGDPVTFGKPLVGIDTDNVTLKVRSPVTGVLSKILVKVWCKIAPAPGAKDQNRSSLCPRISNAPT